MMQLAAVRKFGIIQLLMDNQPWVIYNIISQVMWVESMPHSTPIDIFQLNFLFRNLDGTVVEDAGGSNYGFEIDPGYFIEIIDPNLSPLFLESGEAFTCNIQSDSVATSWSLDLLDSLGNTISNIGTCNR